MKLFYHRFPDSQNFGDDLNLWLWDRLLPGVFDGDATATFVGIGTLLNDHLEEETPQARTRIVFSSGVGYSDGAFALDDTYRVYCVRGPLSAEALGLPPEKAITDGAVLVRRLSHGERRKRHRFTFMPHVTGISNAWREVSEELGFGYIDPRWETERVLNAIGETEILLTAAMHGAIVADALRIPWVPVTTSSCILAFKWEDWCRSLGLTYNPFSVLSLYKPEQTTDIWMAARQAKFLLRQRTVAAQMKRIARTARPLLSRDSDLERATVRLEERLDAFKRDVRFGVFDTQGKYRHPGL